MIVDHCPKQCTGIEIAYAYLSNPNLNSQALISVDPNRAREDPVIVKNIPFYKAKKALAAEVMKLNPPPRPDNWGVCILLKLLAASSFMMPG